MRPNTQYATASTSAPRAIIGRRMKGGRSITSRPLVLFPAGSGIRLGVGLGEGLGDGVTTGDFLGVGVGVGWFRSWNCAQGNGFTLAEMWWGPSAAAA